MNRETYLLEYPHTRTIFAFSKTSFLTQYCREVQPWYSHHLVSPLPKLCRHQERCLIELCVDCIIPGSPSLNIVVFQWEYFLKQNVLISSSALVWGSSVKHMPQKVGKDHVLNDEDVVQIVKKIWRSLLLYVSMLFLKLILWLNVTFFLIWSCVLHFSLDQLFP